MLWGINKDNKFQNLFFAVVHHCRDLVRHCPTPKTVKIRIG